MQINIPIKLLSVNDAWKGRRFKSPAYSKYEKLVMLLLPRLQVERPQKIGVKFNARFSNKKSDLDNITKPLLDILVKRYGWDDSRIYQIVLEKEIVERGSEGVGIEFFEIL